MKRFNKKFDFFKWALAFIFALSIAVFFAAGYFGVELIKHPEPIGEFLSKIVNGMK